MDGDVAWDWGKCRCRGYYGRRKLSMALDAIALGIRLLLGIDWLGWNTGCEGSDKDSQIRGIGEVKALSRDAMLH